LLQLQIMQKEKEIKKAEEELKAFPPNSFIDGCVGSGLCFMGPIGAIIWYFNDVKPKNIQKSEINKKIDQLISEKEQLQDQLQMLVSKEPESIDKEKTSPLNVSAADTVSNQGTSLTKAPVKIVKKVDNTNRWPAFYSMGLVLGLDGHWMETPVGGSFGAHPASTKLSFAIFFDKPFTEYIWGGADFTFERTSTKVVTAGVEAYDYWDQHSTFDTDIWHDTQSLLLSFWYKFGKTFPRYRPWAALGFGFAPTTISYDTESFGSLGYGHCSGGLNASILYGLGIEYLIGKNFLLSENIEELIYVGEDWNASAAGHSVNPYRLQLLFGVSF
jgi:hypothetical protein